MRSSTAFLFCAFVGLGLGAYGTVIDDEVEIQGRFLKMELAPDEGGFRSEMVIPPTVGDLGEVTFDVIGLLDDAQLGWRLHIFGQPTEGGEGFSLKSVEGTALCGRGVTDDGLCI